MYTRSQEFGSASLWITLVLIAVAVVMLVTSTLFSAEVMGSNNTFPREVFSSTTY